MPASTLCDCNHPSHAADACTGLVTRHFGGGSNVNGAPHGEWDADDQPCRCDLPPLCEVHAFDRVDNDLLSCAVCGEITEAVR